MAALYNLEPQPTAKAILHTTAGEIALEIFAKQTPLASRNFLQHCLDGYYDNTIFHRLVPGFIIQGGDPTGTGHGGISAIADGAGFEDELHSRLKFNRRGLLGMAREEGGSNGSQFFFTLGDTRELQGKHTVFGRIEGDTIYNLMKMGDAELAEGEESDRPLYPTRITSTEVLVNPFEHMVARVREAPRVLEGKQEMKKRKKPAGKNVLSFGMDEGDEEGGSVQLPVLKKVKANPKLVVVGDEPEKDDSKAAASKKKAPKVRKQETHVEDNEPVETTKPQTKLTPDVQPNDVSDSDSEQEPDEAKAKSQAQLDKTNAEIAALKASMKRAVDTAPKAKEIPKNALEAMIPTTSTRGRKRGKTTDEKGVFDMFKAFKNRLEDLPAGTEAIATATAAPTDDTGSKPTEPLAPKPAAEDDDEATLCDLHFIANCQSCKAWDDDLDTAEGERDVEVEDSGAWMTHSLTFVKDTLGKDLEWKRKMEEIEVIDPREKARVIREEGKRKGGVGKGKGKGRAV